MRHSASMSSAEAAYQYLLYDWSSSRFIGCVGSRIKIHCQLSVFMIKPRWGDNVVVIKLGAVFKQRIAYVKISFLPQCQWQIQTWEDQIWQAMLSFLTKFLSLEALYVIKLITSGTTGDRNFFRMMTVYGSSAMQWCAIIIPVTSLCIATVMAQRSQNVQHGQLTHFG